MRFSWAALAAWLALASCDDASEQCHSNRDCAPSEICVGGSCASAIRASGCDEPSDCEAGFWCDIVDRQCKPLQSQPDAGSPLTDASGDDATVDPGDDGGVQPPADGSTSAADSGPTVCNTDPECGAQPRNICLNNTCSLGCTEQGGLLCTGGTTCDPMTGRCVTPTEVCMVDGDCMPGPPVQVCDNDVCVAGCLTNPNRCTTGTEICNQATGRCEAAPIRCGMDTDCMPGPPMQVCEGTQCVPGCAEQGGIQCSGATPFCNTTTGRCDAPPPCNLDADCGDPDQICVNMACVVRCDRPGGTMCTSPEVCNPESGRCVAGNQALGALCSFDAQCTTEFCIGLNFQPMMTTFFCSASCGSSRDCPIDLQCIDINGAGVCVPENLPTPPAQWDTPAGGMCTAMTATCQSGWCNTRDSVCLDTCSRDADCASTGGNCWTYQRTNMTSGGEEYDHLCVQSTGAASGQPCAVNSDCGGGICNRYTSTCGRRCCADTGCGAGEACVLYDLDTATGAAVKLCAPLPAMAGAGAHGDPCSTPADCATGACVPTVPTSSTSPRKCSSSCCIEGDCSVLPMGGKCRPFPAQPINMVNTYMGYCVPN